MTETAPAVSAAGAMPVAGKILVTDDDPSARGAMIAVLERAGFACRPAHDAAAALGWLASEPFDLIVADIHMTGNVDLEMVRELNARESSLPVILVTGQPSIETAAQAVRLKVFDYLLKPVAGARLVALAREGVASHRAMDLLRAQRGRLKTSLAEIDRCEELARNATGPALNAALGAYLRVAMQQSLSTIGEIGDLAAAVIAGDKTGAVQRRMETTRPLLLVDAVRDTIQVLERTKASFKSRELAELRKRLEDLVKPGSGA